MVKPIMNLDDVEFDDVEENGIYTSKRGTISDRIGASKLGYNLTVGLVTLVPQVFIYNVLNRQSETYQNISYIIAAQGDPNQFNPDYGKVVGRTPPRQFVFALKAMF